MRKADATKPSPSWKRLLGNIRKTGLPGRASESVFFKLNDMTRAEQAMHQASDLAHQPRVTEQWRQLRARMGLSPASQ